MEGFGGKYLIGHESEICNFQNNLQLQIVTPHTEDGVGFASDILSLVNRTHKKIFLPSLLDKYIGESQKKLNELIEECNNEGSVMICNGFNDLGDSSTMSSIISGMRDSICKMPTVIVISKEREPSFSHFKVVELHSLSPFDIERLFFAKFNENCDQKVLKSLLSLDVFSFHIITAESELDTLNKVRRSMLPSYIPMPQSNEIRCDQREIFIQMVSIDARKSIQKALHNALQSSPGICIWGPPGTGKTHLARQITRGTRMMTDTSAIDVAQHLFRVYQEKSPIVTMLLDEGEQYVANQRSTILSSIGQVPIQPNLIIILTTNKHPSQLDPALTRTGRLSQIEVGFITRDEWKLSIPYSPYVSFIGHIQAQKSNDQVVSILSANALPLPEKSVKVVHTKDWEGGVIYKGDSRHLHKIQAEFNVIIRGECSFERLSLYQMLQDKCRVLWIIFQTDVDIPHSIFAYYKSTTIVDVKF